MFKQERAFFHHLLLLHQRWSACFIRVWVWL